MKAIKVTYLGPTNRKGSRLKAWTEAGSMTEAMDYSLNIGDQAESLARRYAQAKGWPEINGFGMLTNGNYVATLKQRH